MDKIKRFIEVLVPITCCNLKCSYCYIIQEGRRKNEIPNFKYSPKYIRRSLSKQRLGGTAYISICGAGETLLVKELPAIIYELLDEGHYINITTNGTITKQFSKILEFPEEYLSRLHFAFSFHYLELKNKGLINTFFTNINRVKRAGCSFIVQINLCDEYLPHLDKIKTLCIENVGAMPQVAATRKEDGNNSSSVLFTELTNEEYFNTGKSFQSPLFDFTMKNFMVKRKEFCYAGDWSFTFNLETGDAQQCYFCQPTFNVYEHLDSPLKLCAIGHNCHNRFCTNSSHFMSLGIIPSIKTPTYADLRNREDACWYSDKMLEFLNGKLYDSNREYSTYEKNILFINQIYIKLKHIVKRILNKFNRILKRSNSSC